MLLGMRRLWGSAVAVALLAGSFGVSAAHAQQDFVESDPGVVRAREQVAAAQLAAHQAAAELEAITQQRDAVQASIDEHVATIEELGRQRETLAAYRDALRDGDARAGGGAVPQRWRTAPASRRSRGRDRCSRPRGARRSVRRPRPRATTAPRASSTRRARSSRGCRRRCASRRRSCAPSVSELDRLVAQQAERQAVVDQKVAAANAALEQARAVGRAPGRGRSGHGAVDAHGRPDGGMGAFPGLPAAHRRRPHGARADLHRRRHRRGRARRFRVRAGGHRDRRLRVGPGQQLLGHRVVRHVLDRQPVPDATRGRTRARSSCS